MQIFCMLCATLVLFGSMFGENTAFERTKNEDIAVERASLCTAHRLVLCKKILSRALNASFSVEEAAAEDILPEEERTEKTNIRAMHLAEREYLDATDAFCTLPAKLLRVYRSVYRLVVKDTIPKEERKNAMHLRFCHEADTGLVSPVRPVQTHVPVTISGGEGIELVKTALSDKSGRTDLLRHVFTYRSGIFLSELSNQRKKVSYSSVGAVQNSDAEPFARASKGDQIDTSVTTMDMQHLFEAYCLGRERGLSRKEAEILQAFTKKDCVAADMDPNHSMIPMDENEIIATMYPGRFVLTTGSAVCRKGNTRRIYTYLRKKTHGTKTLSYTDAGEDGSPCGSVSFTGFFSSS